MGKSRAGMSFEAAATGADELRRGVSPAGARPVLCWQDSALKCL